MSTKEGGFETWGIVEVMGHKQFASRGIVDVQPTLDTLRASSKDAFDEYERRVQRLKVQSFSDVQSQWPTLRSQLLTRWQEQVDKDAYERLEGAKRRRGVVKPTMPNAPSLPPLELPIGPRVEMR